jgi:hypothetical protein
MPRDEPYAEGHEDGPMGSGETEGAAILDLREKLGLDEADKLEIECFDCADVSCRCDAILKNGLEMSE